MHLNFELSLLDKKTSTTVKGVLILLIILGHNSILMHTQNGDTPILLYRYLYHFHVYCFLILPMLYNVPVMTCSRLKKDISHLFKPYVFLFIALVSYQIILGERINPERVFEAFISGNEPLIKGALGASFPWFLPTMFTFLILRNTLCWRPKLLKIVFAISVTVYLLTRVLNVFSLYTFNYFLGCMVALAYFSVGIIVRKIYLYITQKKEYIKFVHLITVVSTVLFFIYYKSNYMELWFSLNAWVIMPISVFISLLSIIEVTKEFKFMYALEYLGKITLPIYVFHMFIYNAIVMVIGKLHIPINCFIGVIAFFLTIGLCLFLIKLLKRFNLYLILFGGTREIDLKM